MKKCLLTLLCIAGFSSVAFSQYGESMTEVKKFTNSEKKFNDWSVSIYGGLPFMQASDLSSFKNGQSDKLHLGYEVQLGITKSLTHVFGIQALAGIGESNQGFTNYLMAKTKYTSISLLGDINLTSLMRRVDNKSTYKWGFHVYAGGGYLGYKTYQSRLGGPYEVVTDQPIDQGSLFVQFGTGLKYKISRRLDAELKAMYMVSGDDSFDGGGNNGVTKITNSFSSVTSDGYYDVFPNGENTLINSDKRSSDNILAFYLGVSYKFGKHKEHLQWFDPLQEIYPSSVAIGGGKDSGKEEGCVSGDNDQDGVCDDWDKELDTPAGARVDGSGVALDTDLDGIIDLFDKCPTYPSNNKENGGCPTLEQLLDVINNGGGSIDKKSPPLAPIEFELNSDKITGESIPTLDNIVSLLKQFYTGEPIVVEGHTDAYGKPYYNQQLSEKRVKSVITYLGSKGVDISKFTPVGKGQSELKYPECNPASKCPDFKNRQNRRVIFKIAK